MSQKRYKSLKEIRIHAGLWWDDIDATNLADHNFMCEIDEYDVDIYFLIDRHCKYFITEIWVNI